MRVDLTKPFETQEIFYKHRNFVNMIHYYREELTNIKENKKCNLSDNEKKRLCEMNILKWNKNIKMWELTENANGLLKEYIK